MRFRFSFRALALLALPLTGACSSDAASPTLPDPPAGLQVTVQEDVVVLTQNVVPEVTMEALFDGDVILDEAGCMRLATDGAHTVIWPVDYGVRSEGSDRIVHDDQGNPVGVIGGSFTVSGGEVSGLSDALGFTDADRALAASQCPGGFWIVG